MKLEGAGVVTYWQFPPEQTRCPVWKCEIELNSRSDALIHYKRQHATSAILCELCDRPVAAHSANTFIAHYQRTHPFKKVPYNLDDGSTNSSESQVS